MTLNEIVNSSCKSFINIPDIFGQIRVLLNCPLIELLVHEVRVDMLTPELQG